MHKGGRGLKAAYSTEVIRIPSELSLLVSKISEQYKETIALNKSFTNTIIKLLQVLEDNKISWKVGDTCTYQNHRATITQIWKRKVRITYSVTDLQTKYNNQFKVIVLISEIS